MITAGRLTPNKNQRTVIEGVAKVAASGSWVDPNTFQMRWRYYETPHHDTVTCRFGARTVEITFLSSIAQMSPTPKDSRPVLQGRMQD